MDGTLALKKYNLVERVKALEEGGSGSGLPNYSTEEQKTGQKWIDGKDIYFRTFDLGNDVAFTNDWVNMSAYISIVGWDKPIGGSWGVNSTGVCVNVNAAINAGYLEIKVGFSGELRYLTLYYTKTEE